MKNALFYIFYKIRLLKLIDILWRKTSAFLSESHIYLQKKDLEKRGSTIGLNVFIDPSVRVRIGKDSYVKIGDNVKILNDSWLITEKGDNLIIGDNTFISQNVVISGNVSIGSDVLIAGYVSIIDANHNYSDISKNITEQGGNKKSIKIGNDVWIGTHSVILQGVTIGSHSVIGANSTVTRNIDEYSVVAGSPAKVIKERITSGTKV